MTGIGTEDVPGHWLTAAEVARASQLREDLVERFLPAMQPQENLYSRDLVSVARFVRVLTDLGTPTAAVEVAVAELRARPDAAFSVALGSGGGGGRRQLNAKLTGTRARAWKTIGVTTAAALLVGGVVAVTLSGRHDEQTAAGPAPSNAAKPVPAEVVAPAVMDEPGAKPAQAFAAAKPDPVCAQWQRASAGYDGRQEAWGKTDHRVPAARWSPKQRSVTMAVIPVMREQAAELRRFADNANDPLLVGLLRAQSRYVDNYAAKLPKFEPADQSTWTAATVIGGAAKAVCSTPR
ncbi:MULTISPECIES: hypothetical protein [unclassified Mycolicibacterium]|uniref:hypothetical protein n=1 Tax=unclassified Mycolicibacterium TaxID=2636767 RepID=UPI0012DCB115|nr:MULTISPECIES: hypothetical protein [unclassified Mycolicibacterium]MUL84704.1 hypothetical protein [Mycolicibacterium sp. CBMA 329]MUL88479.1 hypothetical protein [Mycolicibacterium sp. CBMA 331]MUM00182.1 hypothetical protein [Mycolicibacterium sp. CBMA 334]MUM27846.1 hypothetical protein [Mycolicibacterium sp. CBMA 295]MUM40126.1 hypothetical protein [Mycolicibacterium sp. CBMA 247]